ncbi:hypothetical protein N7474_010834, partial [Penicillium riverlandense]|uniref:uncharacterized protein n=1 Tax=Penicillium riverlandense TaxID=1903569 RepID=UPI002547EC01
MAGECSYNCSERPKEIQFDADITGTGVLIGFISTAGLVTVIIALHYLLAYRPALHPFRQDKGEDDPSVDFRPNEVDMMILKAVRRTSKSLDGVSQSDPRHWSRLESSLTKCVLSMSDLQIATGIAILVSGYAQLPCGLSCYHWQIMGRLAWFSSLTHLSCLTMLRNYLCNRSAQRQWRLLSMLALLILLVVAMVPTGSYEWSVSNNTYQSFPHPSDYAICHFSQLPRVGTAATVSMSIFVLLSTLGFLIRVVKLHNTLSTFLVGRPREIVSKHARNVLWKFYKQPNAQRLPQRIAGNMVYFPALAFFLAMRVLLDHWASMYFEVYWLLMSFLYGLFSVLVEINVFTGGDIIPPVIQNNYTNRWSIGQIMPVFLLAVPLVTIIELLYPGKSTILLSLVPSLMETDSVDDAKGSAGEDISSQPAPLTYQGSNTTSTHNLSLETAQPENSLTHHPDQDYYHNSTALKCGNLFIMLMEYFAGGAVLVVTC